MCPLAIQGPLHWREPLKVHAGIVSTLTKVVHCNMHPVDAVCTFGVLRQAVCSKYLSSLLLGQ